MRDARRRSAAALPRCQRILPALPARRTSVERNFRLSLTASSVKYGLDLVLAFREQRHPLLAIARFHDPGACALEHGGYILPVLRLQSRKEQRPAVCDGREERRNCRDQ